MENEDPREEPLKDRSITKMRNRRDRQNTVLRQLNNQNLYPLQERIGIYVIAALSALGLVLITYTGVMALVSNTTNGLTDPIDVDEVHEFLEEIDDLLEPGDGLEDPDQGGAELQPNEGETADYQTNNADIGIINDNMVQFRREPGGIETITLLHEGYRVTIIDLNYNAYWSHVSVETDLGSGTTILEGFIYTHFIDIEE